MYVTAKGPKSISATQTHTLNGELKKKKQHINGTRMISDSYMPKFTYSFLIISQCRFRTSMKSKIL